MGEVYLISDTHFYHFKIIRYCNRPFEDEDKMNFEMEKRWSILVQPEDVLIHVGDLTAGLKGRKEALKALITRLPGRKVLVKGNHDHQDDEFYLSAGFESVVDYITINNILFAHVPDTLDAESSHPHPWAAITKKLREAFMPKLIIHGHIHRNDTPEFEGHFNCAADRHNFMPFTLQSALERSNLGDLAKSANEDIYTWLEQQKVAADEKNTITL